MPPRCVLNGLEVIPIPVELTRLDCLSKQFIQCAKSYQTVVRLGTKTLKTLDQVSEPNVALASPELYIIINRKPTKNQVVWRNLVNVNHIMEAIRKLREINWLYKDVDDDSIDSTLKEVIEAVSSTSSTMLEKATDEDIAGFQSYTIRTLDKKLTTGSDIE